MWRILQRRPTLNQAWMLATLLHPGLVTLTHSLTLALPETRVHAQGTGGRQLLQPQTITHEFNSLSRKFVTTHKSGAVAPGVASPLTRSSSQDVSDELPAGRKKFQL